MNQVSPQATHEWVLLAFRYLPTFNIYSSIKLEKPRKLCETIVSDLVMPALKFMSIVPRIKDNGANRFHYLASFPISLLEEANSILAMLSNKYENEYQKTSNGQLSLFSSFPSFQDAAIVKELNKLLQKVISEAKRTMSCVDPTLRKTSYPCHTELAFEINKDVKLLNIDELSATYTHLNAKIQLMEGCKREIEVINYPLF